jgi:hypothetical protein
MKEKFIRYIVQDEGNFFLVTSKNYDRDIDILCTETSDFNVSIKRYIEPDVIDVYDAIVFKDNEGEKRLRTVMVVGGTIYVD